MMMRRMCRDWFRWQHSLEKAGSCQLEQNIRKHIRNYAMKQIESINPDAFKYADGISSLDVMADLNTGKPTDTWISLYGSKAS